MSEGDTLLHLCVDAVARWVLTNSADRRQSLLHPGRLSVLPWPVVDQLLLRLSELASRQHGDMTGGLTLAHMRHFYGGQISALRLAGATDSMLTELLGPCRQWPYCETLELHDKTLVVRDGMSGPTRGGQN